MAGKRVWIPVVLLGVLVLVVPHVGAQLSGYFGIDISARRIPTTVSDETMLDTPSEFAMLEFGVASVLDATVDFGLYSLNVDAAVNMAGPEHFVIDADLSLDEINVYGLTIDKVRLVPELWFAVPFEAVTDVNGLANSVVIPDGDAMFVAGRLTATARYNGFTLKQVLLFQDTEFPAPGASFEPLEYPLQSQSFGGGSLTYVSWRAQAGFSVSSVTGINATQASYAIKGHSAIGKVVDGEFSERLSVSGISLPDLSAGAFTLKNPQVGVSALISSTQSPSGTVSFSASISNRSSISTSITLYGGEHTLGGITLSGSLSPFRFSFAIDEMDMNSLSASFSLPLSLGSTTGSVAASLTGLQAGLTGCSARLSIAQGMLSGSTSVSYSQSGEKLKFASLATRISFRLAPGIVSLQATFSRYGLSRMAVSTGISF